MKLFSEFININNNKFYSYGRFDCLMEQDSSCVIDGYEVSNSVLSSIKKFYNETNVYNRAKITDMINNNVKNIEKVINIIYEYESLKK